MGNEIIIGDKLRQARLNKNISIDELQKKTKIQKRYLEAIERGDFKLLPGDYYVRTFLREYAAVVGLDGSFLVAVFDGEASFDAPPPKRSAPETAEGSRVAKERKHATDYIPMILLGLIAFTIITIVGYMTWQDRQSQPMINSRPSSVVRESTSTSEVSTSESTAESTETTSETTESSEEPEMMIELTDSRVAGSTFSIDFDVQEATKPMELMFKVNEAGCWISVTANGEGIFQKTLYDTEEEVILPEDATDVEIILGRSSSVEFLANGELLEYDDSQYELLVKNLHLTIAYAE